MIPLMNVLDLFKATNNRSLFKAQSNIYDGAFFGNKSQQFLAVNILKLHR